MKNDKIKNLLVKERKGFSIGEVMLSVFILGTTLITITSLFSKSAAEMTDNRDSVIAAMLAQEGIELARNNRDTNWTKGESEDNTFDDIVDVANCVNGLSWSGGDDDGGYVCSGGKFKRSVALESGCSSPSDDTCEITSMVIWNDSIFPAVNDCNIANNCVYSQAIFSNWGYNN